MWGHSLSLLSLSVGPVSEVSSILDLKTSQNPTEIMQGRMSVRLGWKPERSDQAESQRDLTLQMHSERLGKHSERPGQGEKHRILQNPIKVHPSLITSDVQTSYHSLTEQGLLLPSIRRCIRKTRETRTQRSRINCPQKAREVPGRNPERPGWAEIRGGKPERRGRKRERSREDQNMQRPEMKHLEGDDKLL